ncbi:MAG TPA: FkbM family methyltransferase [Patescibacteria group bacterium]|nr:FkbM family methyltransferase [Patescibacteria group bacterium]
MLTTLLVSHEISLHHKSAFIIRYICDMLFNLILPSQIKTFHFIDGKKFKYFGIHKNLLLDHIYNHLKYYSKYYSGAEVVVDAGASFGTFSAMVHYLNPNCDIYSVEMDKTSFNLLEGNCTGIKKIHLFHNAVGDKNAQIGYYFNNLYPEGSQVGGRKEGQYKKVSQVTLDRLVELNHIRKISLLKIDTEGYEVHVLKGAHRTLSISDCVIIETDIFLPNLIRVLRVMAKHGFFLVYFGVVNYDQDRIGSLDLIFKKKTNAVS